MKMFGLSVIFLLILSFSMSLFSAMLEITNNTENSFTFSTDLLDSPTEIQPQSTRFISVNSYKIVHLSSSRPTCVLQIDEKKFFSSDIPSTVTARLYFWQLSEEHSDQVRQPTCCSRQPMRSRAEKLEKISYKNWDELARKSAYILGLEPENIRPEDAAVKITIFEENGKIRIVDEIQNAHPEIIRCRFST